MIKKSYSKTRKFCRVTFKLAPEGEAGEASLCGEFNGWDPSANKMKKLKDGSFSATLSLEADKSYRFRYLIDGETWENDAEADEYVANDFGTEDAVVTFS